METLTDWKKMTLNSFNEMGTEIMLVVPKLLGALSILLVGWIITKIVVYVLKKILRLAKVNRLTELIQEKELFGKTEVKIDIVNVIASFAKWLLFLVFLIAASDVLNWTIVSVEIGNLLRYLPKLFSAIALFMVGLYIATYVKKAIRGLFDSFDLNGAKNISGLVFYIIIVIITITALNQAGIDTAIITNNLTIILGAFLAAIALAFGFGSKEVVGDLLKAFYVRKNFEIGEKIEVENISGTIESIDNITISIKTKNGRMVLPIKKIVENQVEVTS